LECDEYIKETDQRARSVVMSLVKALFLRDHAGWFRLGRQQEQLPWIQTIANMIDFGNQLFLMAYESDDTN